jgi:outer membrane protein assembly factor BamB
MRLAKKVEISPRPTRGKGRQVFLARAVVGHHSIYVADAADQGSFAALSREGLEPRWSRPAQGFRPLSAWGLTLVAISNNAGSVGVVDGETGEEIWRRACDFGLREWRGAMVAQQVSAFEVLAPDTGRVEDVINVSSTLSRPAPIWRDIALLSDAAQTDRVCGFSLHDRRIMWERTWLSEMGRFGLSEAPTLVLSGGSVANRFVATGRGSLFGCSLDDGALLWHQRFSVPYYWPNVHAGRIYVLCPPHFIAVDEATGELIYDVVHRELEPVRLARMGTIYGDRIAFPAETGHVTVFDLRDGSLLWLHQYRASVEGIAEADGRLLASMGDGRLVVFEDAA